MIPENINWIGMVNVHFFLLVLLVAVGPDKKNE